MNYVFEISYMATCSLMAWDYHLVAKTRSRATHLKDIINSCADGEC